MQTALLGIDISKKKLDCALWVDGKLLDKTCDNSAAGVAQLLSWLAKRKVERVHACMEASGGFEEVVATQLFEAGHGVSVLNPMVIHAFGKQRLERSKTDRIDARTITEYARRNGEDLVLWQPPPKELTELRDLVKRRQALVEIKTQELNRLQFASGGPEVDAMVREHVSFLEGQIAKVEAAIRDHIDRHPGLKVQHELLSSIPGVGDQTAALFLAEVGAKLPALRHPKQLVCYCGMDVRRRESGTSVWSRPRMSKVGNRKLRAALFMPAMAAIRYNPVVSALNARLVAQGKPFKLRVGAAMRKLLHLMYGVLKTGRRFDPAHA